MSIKRNWSRHGSEVVIRWYQRFFLLAASRLIFAALPLNSVAPNEKKKTLWYQGRIIKVSVRVIDFILQLWLITPTSTLIVLDITKTSSGNCLKSNSFSHESFAWRLILEQRHKVTQKLPITFRNHFYDTKHTIHTIHIHHKTKFAVLEVCYLE